LKKEDQMTNLTLANLLDVVEPVNRKKCYQLLIDNMARFEKAKGSSYNHQAWEGGYLDHIREVMSISLTLYSALNSMRPLPFSINDAVLVLFLHDLEKPWKDAESIWDFTTKAGRKKFRLDKLEEYDIQLSFEQSNALEYVEGEGDDYSSERRIMNEMAAFCHMCDVASARIWHDKPEQKIDAV
jgi:hypothetical protein